MFKINYTVLSGMIVDYPDNAVYETEADARQDMRELASSMPNTVFFLCTLNEETITALVNAAGVFMWSVE